MMTAADSPDQRPPALAPLKPEARALRCILLQGAPRLGLLSASAWAIPGEPEVRVAIPIGDGSDPMDVQVEEGRLPEDGVDLYAFVLLRPWMSACRDSMRIRCTHCLA